MIIALLVCNFTLINKDKKTSSIINIKKKIMGNLLYVVAIILVIAWAIGFIGYSAGGLIHLLLVIAVIAIILRVIQGRKVL